MTWYDHAGEFVRKLYDHRIEGPPVLDPVAYFPHARLFVDAWQDIREESERVARDLLAVPRFHEILSTQADISANDDRDWRMFLIKAYGTPIRKNVAQCPKLAALLEQCPEVLSATFSYLAPHKHIPCHRGPFRGVIRFHLGLSVPKDANGEPAAVLNIDGRDYRIGDGESLLWDDTYPHEVWNRSESVRAALLLDIRRSGMPWDLQLLSNLIIGVVGTGLRVRQYA